MNKNLALIISGIVCMSLISCVENTQTSNSVSNQIDMNSTIIDCLDKLIKASHKARFFRFYWREFC